MADLNKLIEQNTNIRNYLLNYWGYTDRMIDEVMRTGQTPHRAVYLDDETMVLGKKVTTTMERKDNLCNYLMDFWGYSKKQVDEVGETGETPEGQPSILPGAKLTTKQYIDKVTSKPNPISPQHYQQGNIPVLDFITDQKFTYLEGNIVKYICRYKTKNGVEDLEKAEYYLKELKDTYCIDIKHKFAQQIDEDTLCG
tara:strand:+ start:254 stop:844 length:591 start_codon:yes stop_codon:yes gene_type:complete